MRFKKYWVQILVWVLCAVIAYGLYTLIRDDRTKDEEHYAELQLQAANSEQTDVEKLEAQTDIYDKLYAQIDVNDFVCWGDSAMAGSSNRSLPVLLKKVVEQNLFSSLEKTFSRVFEEGEYTTPSVTVNNMGVSNEGMRQILARAGVNTMETGEAMDIPWSTDPVPVRFMDEEAWSKLSDKNQDEQLKFANQKSVSFGKVYINGIRGSLVTTDDWFDSNHPRYAFVRKDEGDDSTRIPEGTEIEIESATKYLGNTPILFFENDSGRSVDGLVSDMEELVNRYAYTNQEKDDDSAENRELEELDEDNKEIKEIDESTKTYEIPFVVICTTMENSDLDKALVKQFGDRYIRNDGYSSEMTERTYRKLAQEVYDNLDSQGCFDDVKAQIALAVEEAG